MLGFPLTPDKAKNVEVWLLHRFNYCYGICIILPEASNLRYELGLLRFAVDTNYSTVLPFVRRGPSTP